MTPDGINDPAEPDVHLEVYADNYGTHAWATVPIARPRARWANAWMVAARLTVRNDTARMTELRIFPNEHEWRLWKDYEPFDWSGTFVDPPLPPSDIPVDALRAVPLRELRAALLRYAGEQHLLSNVENDDDVQREVNRSRGRPTTPDPEVASHARALSLHHVPGETVGATLQKYADARKCSFETAKRHRARCIDKGMLNDDFTLTPACQDILDGLRSTRLPAERQRTVTLHGDDGLVYKIVR